MSVLGIPQLMIPATQQTAVMTGSNVLIGTITHMPVKIIFNSLSTVNVEIYLSFDGGTTLIDWLTFTPGMAFVLDEDLWSNAKGMQVYGNGASGSFQVSYNYIKQ